MEKCGVAQIFGSIYLLFKLFLEGKKSFCSCPPYEISTISQHEDKANAHAGMSHCDVLQFAIPAL